MVGRRQPFQARAYRRLAEDEADPRGRDGPAVGVRVVPQAEKAAWAGQTDERRRRPFAEALPVAERVFLDELMRTEDVREGIASFFEKRRPEWKNR